MKVMKRTFMLAMAVGGLFVGVASHAAGGAPNIDAQIQAFALHPTYCNQLEGSKGAGVDGLDQAFSNALGDLLTSSGDVTGTYNKLNAACASTKDVTVQQVGGVAGFVLHPSHCNYLGKDEASAPASYRVALKSALDNLSDEEMLLGMGELKELCSLKTAIKPKTPAAS